MAAQPASASHETPPASETDFALSQAQLDHFLEHGWLKLRHCFTQSQADALAANLWTRLGMHPTDQSTWTQSRVHMGWTAQYPVSSFAPKAWHAICELVGGEARIHPETQTWNNGLIVNLGSPEGAGKVTPAWKEEGWHVDGDFFVHYLDSPEQGLLVIPLFTPIRSGGGATWICPGGIKPVAEHLFEHPEGVSPRMTTREANPSFEESNDRGLGWYNGLVQRIAEEQGESAFVEATGEVGDVYLLHPLMVHSASNNRLRELRVITNPPVGLSGEMQFVEKEGRAMSWVEKKTARELGERVKGWRRQGERQRIVPERVKIQNKMKEEEARRLKQEAAVKVTEVGVEA